jgi:hypothetical protein
MDDEAEFMAASAAFKQQSRGSVVAAACIGLVLGGVVGAGTMAATGGAQSKRSRPQAAPAAESAAPKSSASAAPAEVRPPSLAERVTSGAADARKELEARPMEARTAEEATALAYARASDKKTEINDLKRKITLVPKIVNEDKPTASRIKELSSDREVATAMLSMLVSLPGNVGTDLLYSLFRDMKAESENANFAEQLLYSKDVRPKLSPPLAALLDVRRAEKCEPALGFLKVLKAEGDRRALPSLMRFYNKRGCGDKKLDDCWKCLRSPDILKDVTAEIAKRPAP